MEEMTELDINKAVYLVPVIEVLATVCPAERVIVYRNRLKVLLDRAGSAAPDVVSVLNKLDSL